MQYLRKYIPLAFLTLLLFGACTKKDEPTQTTLSGIVKNSLNDTPVYPAYIIYDKQLIASASEGGTYKITSLEGGTYTMTCSAIGFSDQSMQVLIENGKATGHDFLLTPDETESLVMGELHDQVLYQQQLVDNPSMANWTDQELFDGVSGATIQGKNFDFDVHPASIYIGDSLFAKTDDYGQYLFEVQIGTYPITVVSEGWRDSLQIKEVVYDSYAVFANYILPRE